MQHSAIGLALGAYLVGLGGCSSSDASTSGAEPEPGREMSHDPDDGTAAAASPPESQGGQTRDPDVDALGPPRNEGSGGNSSLSPPESPPAGIGADPPTPEVGERPGVSASEPILPALSGDCPDFKSGAQRILGLDTQLVVGTPRDTKGPLLFTWHGTGGTGTQALLQLPRSVQDEIIAAGGIIVAPTDNGQVRAGADVTFVLGVWYDGADLAYADQIVACAVRDHNIDPRRIYVTGCSAGGLMAGVMSLARSSYVAAAAPNSGGLAIPGYRLQDPSRVPAVMTMHGGQNDTVIVNFETTSQNLASALTPQGGFVVECNHGIGHCGAPASLHENAWEFMKAHPFGTRPSPYASGLPADFPDYCQITSNP